MGQSYATLIISTIGREPTLNLYPTRQMALNCAKTFFLEGVTQTYVYPLFEPASYKYGDCKPSSSFLKKEDFKKEDGGYDGKPDKKDIIRIEGKNSLVVGKTAVLLNRTNIGYPPIKNKAKTKYVLVDGIVYIGGFEYRNKKWKRTLKAFIHNIL